MKILRSREIVIEYERVQTIARRARTQVANCAGCAGESDFVTVSDAAELFNTDSERLVEFISANGIHVQTDLVGTIFVCLNSLLARMRDKDRGQKMLLE